MKSIYYFISNLLTYIDFLENSVTPPPSFRADSPRRTYIYNPPGVLILKFEGKVPKKAQYMLSIS